LVWRLKKEGDTAVAMLGDAMQVGQGLAPRVALNGAAQTLEECAREAALDGGVNWRSPTGASYECVAATEQDAAHCRRRGSVAVASGATRPWFLAADRIPNLYPSCDECVRACAGPAPFPR
jgi:hypothetical protein